MMPTGLPGAAERHIIVLGTGGTIAMREDPARGGAAPAPGARDLVGALPPGLPDVRFEDIVRLPSSHFHLDTVWTIRDRVAQLAEEPEVAGVVVTHGTDTLEEIAFLVDITTPRLKPIVLTGAMRTASATAYDGIANLIAAIRVAATPRSRSLGAVVVLNEEIHAARYTTKMHTHSTDAFKSPGWGPVGRVEMESVVIHCGLEPHTPNHCSRERGPGSRSRGAWRGACPAVLAGRYPSGESPGIAGGHRQPVPVRTVGGQLRLPGRVRDAGRPGLSIR
jgi:L-asparaginase/Glu-tRNA(Gln) amidotransferase subunit D